ncbi:hypothetical protein ACIGW8_01660 [Streptomyces sioyaensis]|uniref:hypothetical protein n=1 Tax=Streptomyces sioyaensis TaxID=67364 RepID=UPI0037D8D7F0
MSHSQQQPASFGRRPHSFVIPPAGQSPRKEHAALKIAVGAVCACTVFGLGAVVGGDGGSGRKPAAQPAPTVAVTFTAKPVQASVGKPEKATGKAAAAVPGTTVGRGSYLVGEDIAAGTYRTGGPAASDIPLCYWARAKGSSGEMGGIIANGIPQGPARVTVTQGETFETDGCQRWTKVG